MNISIMDLELGRHELSELAGDGSSLPLGKGTEVTKLWPLESQRMKLRPKQKWTLTLSLFSNYEYLI